MGWTKNIVKYFIASMEQLTWKVHAAVKHVNMDGKEPSATNEVFISSYIILIISQLVLSGTYL